MRQSRMMSFAEALANAAVGYGVAVLTQIVVSRLSGLEASLAQHLGIGAAFTALTVVRASLLRRVFEAMHG